jgi:hypothetical protein
VLLGGDASVVPMRHAARFLGGHRSLTDQYYASTGV